MNRIFAPASLGIMFGALLAAPLMAIATPAAAQDEAGDRVNMLIIYGEDACPASEGNEIIICARKAEGERFRIPQNLRDLDSAQNITTAERIERLEMVSDFGIQSCSPAGPGGFTGCTEEMIQAAYRDREGGTDVKFGQLIAEARAERLSTIDVDARLEQERVESIEREYMERLEAERAAPIGDENGVEGSALPTPPGE